MTPMPDSPAQVLSAQLTVQPGKQAEFRQTLLSLRKEILLQPGCLECTIGLDAEEDSRFLVFMVWKDQAHLEGHLNSEAFRILLGASQVLTLPTTFRFAAADLASGSPGEAEAPQEAPKRKRRVPTPRSDPKEPT